MVNVTHDGDDGRTWLKIFFCIFDFVDNILNIRIRNSNNFVAEFFDNQFCGICINGLVLCDHHAHFHQRFYNLGNAFSHPVSKFRNYNRFRNLHFANNLFALLGFTHCLLTCTLLFTAHRGHRTLTTAFSTAKRLRNS